MSADQSGAVGLGVVQRRLVTFVAAVGAFLSVSCGGGGGIDFETLARASESSAPYSFHYLGVATTAAEATTVANAIDSADARRAVAGFDHSGDKVLIAFRVGTAAPRLDEVGYIDWIRPREDHVEVRIRWTDDGIEDDNDDDPAPFHMVAAARSDIPDEAMGRWIATDRNGDVVVEVHYPPTWEVTE